MYISLCSLRAYYVSGSLEAPRNRDRRTIQWVQTKVQIISEICD